MRTEEIAHRKCLVHYGGQPATHATTTPATSMQEISTPDVSTSATADCICEPAVAMIQLTARHEAKGMDAELRMLDSGVGRPFVFIGVVLDDWALQLMPWEDEAVSRNPEVGRHAADTLYRVSSAAVAP